MIQRLPFAAWLLSALLLVSCTAWEFGTPEPAGTTLRTLSVLSAPASKSILPETQTFETQIHEVCFAVYGAADGLLAGTSYVQGPETTLRLLCGKNYRVYALVNMGDQRNALPLRENGLRSFRYELGDFSALAAKGMPMTGDSTLYDGEESVGIPLRKLLAKVTFRVDHSGLTGGLEGAGLRHESVHIHQAARALYPFMSPYSMALTTDDIQTGESDYSLFQEDRAYDLLSEDLVFYVPENAQGALLENNSDPMEKVPARLGMDVARRCTYLEFQAVKNGAEDGVSGDVSFRFFLGADTTSDFDIIGNNNYDVALFLSWESLFLQGTWKVTRGEDWEDGRVLALTDSTATAPSCIYLPASGPAQRLDIQFRRGNSARVLGARDEDEYPFGWTLYLDGEPTSASSGTLSSGTTWQYFSSEAEEYLLLTPPVRLSEGETHHIQLKTVDGQMASENLQVEVLPHLEIGFAGSSFRHIAQRGRLQVSNGPEGAHYTWTLSDPRGVAALTQEETGTALLEYHDAGGVTVSVRCQETRQQGSQRLGADQLYMKHNAALYYAWPDGAPIINYNNEPLELYFFSDSKCQRRLQVQKTYEETATGDDLARDLVETYLYPVFTIKNATFLGVVNHELCAVRLKNGSKTYNLSGGKMSEVSIDAAASGVTCTSGSVDVFSVNPYSNFLTETALSPIEDYGLAVPYQAPQAEEDRMAEMPDLRSNRKSVYVKIDGTEAEEGFQNAFSLRGSRITYNFSQVPALTEHRGGSVTLHACLENRHSGERVYSPSFARFDCYVRAVAVARLMPLGSHEADIRVEIAGDYASTPFTALDGKALFDSSLAAGGTFSWNGTTFTVSTYNAPAAVGETLFHLIANREVDWSAFQEAKLPGLRLAGSEAKSYTFDTYYTLSVLDRWLDD